MMWFDSLTMMTGSERLYLSILAFSLVIALSFVLRSIFIFGPSAFALRPIVPFSIFFSLVHFFTPAVKMLEGRFRYQDGYLPETYIFNAFLMLFIYAFCIILLSSVEFSSSQRRFNARSSLKGGSGFDFVLSIVLFLVGLAFALQDLWIIHFEIGLLSFHADSHSYNSVRSRYRLLANLMTLGAALYLGHRLLTGKITTRAIFLLAIMAAPIAFYAVTLSSRNTFFLFGMVFITVLLGFSSGEVVSKPKRSLSLIIKKKSIRLSVGVLVAIGLVFVIASVITEQRYNRFDSAYMFERRENAVYYALEGGFGNDENLLWLFENGGYSHLMGYSYFSGAVSLIPRSIWPNKPTGAGPVLTNIIWPGRYVPGAEGNNSVTTGMVTEALMNFGFPGLILIPLVWAFSLSRSMRLFHRSQNLYFRIAWLIISLLLSTSFVYQEFMGLFARGAVVVAPLFFIGFISHLFQTKKPSSETHNLSST